MNISQIPDNVLIQELRNRNYALSIWQVDDVRRQAIESGILLTDDEIKEIIGNLDRKHDANIGISWGVIDCHIDDYSKSYEGDEAIVTCTIRWYNNNETEQVQIMIGEEDHLHLFKDVYDENIFYYVMDEEEFTKLQHDNDGEFEIVNVHEIRNY